MLNEWMEAEFEALEKVDFRQQPDAVRCLELRL
jgi:hypothetical protein